MAGKKEKKPTKNSTPMPSLIFRASTLSPASPESPPDEPATKKGAGDMETKPAEEVSMRRPPTPPLDHGLAQATASGYSHTAKKILWLGVATFSLIIVVLWGWSLRLQLSLVHFSKSPEGVLIQKTKTNWDQAFAENKPEETVSPEAVKEELKTILNQLVAGVATTASSSNQEP